MIEKKSLSVTKWNCSEVRFNKYLVKNYSIVFVNNPVEDFSIHFLDLHSSVFTVINSLGSFFFQQNNASFILLKLRIREDL